MPSSGGCFIHKSARCSTSARSILNCLIEKTPLISRRLILKQLVCRRLISRRIAGDITSCISRLVLILILSLSWSIPAQAEQLTAAVAANFAGTIKQLEPLFKAQTGHELITSFASTGTLYTQIRNGAPFDILLAADKRHAQQLIVDGLAIKDSLFVYAVGQLVLWSSDPDLIDQRGSVLNDTNWSAKPIQHIALANPDTAPYGAAAAQTLAALSLSERTQNNRVTGQNVAQVFQFVISGNAQLGFIARSQVLALPEATRGSSWEIPTELHTPIEQAAITLKRGKENVAALAFIAFLKSPKAREVIRHSGYQIHNVETRQGPQ